MYLKEKDKRKVRGNNDYLLIKKIFDGKKGKAGARTIKMELEEVLNLKKIRRIMNKYTLVCKIRRINKARVALQKNLEDRYVPNLLNRDFKQVMPHSFASTDITYIKLVGTPNLIQLF